MATIPGKSVGITWGRAFTSDSVVSLSAKHEIGADTSSTAALRGGGTTARRKGVTRRLDPSMTATVPRSLV